MVQHQVGVRLGHQRRQTLAEGTWSVMVHVWADVTGATLTARVE